MSRDGSRDPSHAAGARLRSFSYRVRLQTKMDTIWKPEHDTHIYVTAYVDIEALSGGRMENAT